MTKQKAEWNWRPAGPILLSPLLEWPFRPKAILQWLIAGWHLLGIRVGVLVIAILSWFYLQPALERCVTFQIGWILEIYIRNLCLMILVAGGCHLYFITYSKQGNKLKFDSRAMMRDSRVFLFSDQVKDNIFWTLASGVTIWTGYEVLLMWGFANGYASLLMWQDNPVWFIALLFLQPIWGGFHFHVIHRFLHWPPVYRRFHSLHHRNINIGPWSGLSMHPVEHLLYLSGALIHFVISSHPIHLFFQLQVKSLEAVTSHTGYESLLAGNKGVLKVGDFFHQQHHRYFECNYGTVEVPTDRWFNSFHDGTVEATSLLKQQRLNRLKG